MKFLTPATARFILSSLIFAAIFMLYFFRLAFLPNVVHGDEGETALRAIEIIKNQTNLIGVGWFDLPILSFLPHALGMIIFGQNIVGDRIGSVIFGVFTLPFFYLFVKLLFDKKLATISTLLLATSHMWIALSRIGITYVQATFFAILTLLFLIKGIKNDKKIFFILSGLSLGLGMYSYYAIRILPIIILPLVFFYIFEKFSLYKLVNILLLILAAVIIFFPQGMFFLKNPESFSSRTKMIYVLSEPAKTWTNYQNKTPLQILIEQTKRTFNIFEGDNSTQYGYKGLLLDFLSIFFLILGLLYSLKLKYNLKIFLYLWLFISIAGQVLTSIPPPIFLPRFVIGLPVLYIFIGLGIIEFMDIVKKTKVKKLYQNSFFIFIIGAIVTWNLYTYFIIYPRQPTGDSGSRISTKISSYINTLSKNSIVYFYTGPYLYADYGTLRFLTSGVRKISIKIPDKIENLEIPTVNKRGPIVFIVAPQYFSNFQRFLSNLPPGKLTNFNDVTNQILFYSYKIN